VTQERPDLPDGLAVLIRRCLEKERDRRIQTALDVRNALVELRDAPMSEPMRVPSLRVFGATRRVAASSLLALVLGALGWWGLAQTRESATTVDSIAVLPFVNTNGDPEIDYVATGLTETLTNSLSTVRNVRVVARTRAAKYRDASVDPVQAGRELRVRAVVTGEVSERGELLQVKIELTDVLNDSHLWGERFERPLKDALSLQKSLANAIAVRLRQRLTVEEVAGLAPGTEDAVAYELYLKGQNEFDKRTAASLARATTLFEDATNKDPKYVAAWVGLSRVYGTRAHTELLAPDDAYPKAAAAANSAIAIDERSAPAHAALAVTLLMHGWKWTEAEREFRRAKAIDPEDAEVLFLHGAFFLRYANRPDEALAELERAEALDPTTAAIPAHRAIVLAQRQRYGDAIAAANQALSLAPGSGLAQRHLALVYRVARRCPEAIASSQRMVEARDARGPLFLAAAYATCGQGTDARRLLEQHETRAANGKGQPVLFAAVHTALGSRHEALDWLERGFRDREPTLVGLASAPEFAALAGEPRFQALRKRIGVPSN
jgi:serine/threonine-protein kinase